MDYLPFIGKKNCETKWNRWAFPTLLMMLHFSVRALPVYVLVDITAKITTYVEYIDGRSYVKHMFLDVEYIFSQRNSNIW